MFCAVPRPQFIRYVSPHTDGHPQFPLHIRIQLPLDRGMSAKNYHIAEADIMGVNVVLTWNPDDGDSMFL